MASGASAAAIFAVLAIMVLSSQGQPGTGPSCSDCEVVCAKSCTDQIFNTCKSYCANPFAARQSCQKQVFQQCAASACCNNTCSRDCNLEAQNRCKCVHDTIIDCKSCTGRILEHCPPACYNECCVKKY